MCRFDLRMGKIATLVYTLMVPFVHERQNKGNIVLTHIDDLQISQELYGRIAMKGDSAPCTMWIDKLLEKLRKTRNREKGVRVGNQVIENLEVSIETNPHEVHCHAMEVSQGSIDVKADN